MTAEAFTVDGAKLSFQGKLDIAVVGQIWADVMQRVRGGRQSVDSSGVTEIDSAGAVLLLEAERAGGKTNFWPPEDAAVLLTIDRMRRALDAAPPAKPAEPAHWLARLGGSVIGILGDLGRYTGLWPLHAVGGLAGHDSGLSILHSHAAIWRF